MTTVVKSEIRYAIHVPGNELKGKVDLHYVKTLDTLEDGSKVPNVKLIRDFQRPIWVTKSNFRDHNQKKEYEVFDRLHKKYTTQTSLDMTVANLLDKPFLANNSDAIKSSPYVYGYDVTSTSLLKYTSLKKNNFVQSLYSVASADIEIDPDTKDLILISIVYRDAIHVFILNKFIATISDIRYRLDKAMETYLPKYKNMKLHLYRHDKEIDLIADFFKVANELAPDFLTFWNMNFDIPFILDKIRDNYVNPIDIVCDLTVPRSYRVCRYKEGITKKVTASGVVKPISPSLQWHTLIATTRFYVIDAMCVYRQLRMAKQEEPSYSLNAILDKELKSSKLKFEAANAYSGLNWHIFLQKNYPVEYIVYNIYDCIGILELDDKNKDLCSVLPSFAGITDFSRFNSNPKKIVDALFLFGLERNKVIGTVPKLNKLEVEIIDEELEEEDEDITKQKTLGLKGWIQLLPQNQLVHDGLTCIEEYPDLKTNIRGLVLDEDSISSYPSCTLVANVSKETTINEIIDISGISQPLFKNANLSLAFGPANMLNYFNTMFNLPDLTELKNT